MKKAITLIEMLVTTCILALISLAIMTTFASGLKTYRYVQSYGVKQADILLALEKMQRDINNLIRFSGLDFTGDEKSVSFPGLVRFQDDENATPEIIGTITFLTEEGKNTLLRKKVSVDSLKESTEILAEISKLTFSYYYYDPENEQYSWTNIWETGNGIPLGIQIELSYIDGERTITYSRKLLIPVATG